MKKELPQDVGAWIEGFLTAEKAKVTEQGYQGIVKLARRVGLWLKEAELEPRQVGASQALAYQYQLSTGKRFDGRPHAAGTINNHLKAARRFFDYLMKEGVVDTNPFRSLRRVKVGDHLSENALSVEQMGQLLAALARFDEEKPWWKARKNYRVHVLVEILYSTGLRVSQAAALELGDVNLEEKTLWVRTGRSGQGRTAFLTSYAAQVLGHYLKVRQDLMGAHERDHRHTLFGTGYGRLTQVVNQVLGELCPRLKIPMITSYGFRTSLGAHLVEAGCDLRRVQLLLGLRHLGSTQVYLRRVKGSLRQAMDNAHPRSQWGTQP